MMYCVCRGAEKGVERGGGKKRQASLLKQTLGQFTQPNSVPVLPLPSVH